MSVAHHYPGRRRHGAGRCRRSDRCCSLHARSGPRTGVPVGRRRGSRAPGWRRGRSAVGGRAEGMKRRCSPADSGSSHRSRSAPRAAPPACVCLPGGEEAALSKWAKIFCSTPPSPSTPHLLSTFAHSLDAPYLPRPTFWLLLCLAESLFTPSAGRISAANLCLVKSSRSVCLHSHWHTQRWGPLAWEASLSSVCTPDSRDRNHCRAIDSFIECVCYLLPRRSEEELHWKGGAVVTSISPHDRCLCSS